MSNVVTITCSDTHRQQIKARLEELQLEDPGVAYDTTSAADNLIHMGYILTRLPATEIAKVAKRASEILTEADRAG